MIFKDSIKVPLEIAYKAVGICEHYVQTNPISMTHNIFQEVINHEFPWGYFDGEAGGNPLNVVGVLYSSLILKITLL